MAFLVYHHDDRCVVEITEEYPVEIDEGYDVAETDILKPGDEFEFLITVNEKNVDNKATSLSWMRQSPPAKEILQKIRSLEEAAGVGRVGQRGIAQRLDNLEDRIGALENK